MVNLKPVVGLVLAGAAAWFGLAPRPDPIVRAKSTTLAKPLTTPPALQRARARAAARQTEPAFVTTSTNTVQRAATSAREVVSAGRSFPNQFPVASASPPAVDVAPQPGAVVGNSRTSVQMAALIAETTRAFGFRFPIDWALAITSWEALDIGSSGEVTLVKLTAERQEVDTGAGVLSPGAVCDPQSKRCSIGPWQMLRSTAEAVHGQFAARHGIGNAGPFPGPSLNQARAVLTDPVLATRLALFLLDTDWKRGRGLEWTVRAYNGGSNWHNNGATVASMTANYWGHIRESHGRVQRDMAAAGVDFPDTAVS